MVLEGAPLEDRFVRLEPLTEPHREPLRAACASDPGIWAELYPVNMLGGDYDVRFDHLLEEAAAGRAQPFAVRISGSIKGLTAYLAIDPANKTLEIGSTYFSPEVRGGPANPASKRLLLGAAFGAGTRRAGFRVDALNLRSQAAVSKLGAVREGVLRQDRIVWTGRVRDTVLYSILAEEWSEVLAGLDRRLARYA